MRLKSALQSERMHYSGYKYKLVFIRHCMDKTELEYIVMLRTQTPYGFVLGFFSKKMYLRTSINTRRYVCKSMYRAYTVHVPCTIPFWKKYSKNGKCCHHHLFYTLDLPMCCVTKQHTELKVVDHEIGTRHEHCFASDRLICFTTTITCTVLLSSIA